jgi:outer membrane protein assembly factor BamB
LYALDAATGGLVWSHRLTGILSVFSPAVANGVVYVGSVEGGLHAFEAATGARPWTTSAGAQVKTSPTVAGGRLHIGSEDGVVHAFGP